MKGFNSLKKAAALMGAAVLVSIVLPVNAQTTPRPSNSPQQREDRVIQTTPNQVTPSQTTPNQTDPNQTTPNQATPNQTTPGQRGTSAALSALDREFLLMAARGNNAEIQTSQLALQRSQNATIRAYAQRMIQEHTRANQQLATIASQYGVDLPEDPGPLNAAVAQQLAQLSGASFDRAYLGAQENAHLQAIALYRTGISQGQAQNIRTYASGLLPTITEHYQTASRLVNQTQAGDTQRPLQGSGNSR